MATSLKKRGQKILKKFSRASAKASIDSREHIKENFVQRLSHIRSIRLLIFEWILLVSALVMLAVTQAFWFGESYATDTYIDGGNYVEATVGRVNSMNPLFATTGSEKVLSKLMFSTLVAVDYTGHPGPALAESVASSEDGKTWTIRLRNGLKWSDGEPITNEDVMFTVGLIQNPAVNTIYGANLENVKVSEQGDGSIIFELPAAYADFASALNIPVVPKHILNDVPLKTLVEANFSNTPVTSGAFSFNASQTGTGEDERVYYLSASPNYYLGRPMVSSFAVHTYATKDDVINAINTGSVTATAELSGLDLDKIISSNYEKKNANINSGAFIFFNTSSSKLSNADVRRAIASGIDLNNLRNQAPGTTPLDHPILKSQITLENYPATVTYDFTKAYNALKPLTSQGLHLNIATVNSGYLPAVAEALATELRNLDIEVDVMLYAENQDFVANVISRRNYDLLIYDIELGADPDPLAYYHSSQANASGLNLSNYRNSQVDDLLVGARETLDSALRSKKYENFLQYWATDVPAIGLYQSNMTYLYNKNVRTFSSDDVLVTPIDRFSDITEWAVVKGTRNKTP